MSETLQRERDSDSCRILVLASLTYLIWVIVTYLLEGRILTLLRPEAVIDRTAYTLIANILIGIILALMVIRKAERTRLISLESAGFRPLKRTIIAVIIAFLAGLAILLIQHHGAPNLVVLLNVYAQVLIVTIAEVVMCWGMIGSITEGTLFKKREDNRHCGRNTHCKCPFWAVPYRAQPSLQPGRNDPASFLHRNSDKPRLFRRVGYLCHHRIP